MPTLAKSLGGFKIVEVVFISFHLIFTKIDLYGYARCPVGKIVWPPPS